MINIQEIGYFLYMENQENKERDKLDYNVNSEDDLVEGVVSINDKDDEE